MTYLRVLHDLQAKRWQWVHGFWQESGLERMLSSLIESAVPVDLTNVAEHTRNHDGRSWAELPAVVPPWETSFCEYSFAEYGDDRRVGFLVRSSRDETVEARQSLQRSLDTVPGAIRELEPTGHPLFLCVAFTFWRVGGRTIGPTSTFQWLCHADGRLVRLRPGMGGDSIVYWQTGEDMPETAFPVIADPLFQGFALAHCRNVAQVEQPARYETRQERRAAERRGDKPPVRFYTLRIDPGALRAKREDQSSSTPNPRSLPLHIVRGHFSHYTEDKPMFGKYAGTFWVPAHVRGSADAGLVGKDYAVKAPKEVA